MKKWFFLAILANFVILNINSELKPKYPITTQSISWKNYLLPGTMQAWHSGKRLIEINKENSKNKSLERNLLLAQFLANLAIWYKTIFKYNTSMILKGSGLTGTIVAGFGNGTLGDTLKFAGKIAGITSVPALLVRNAAAFAGMTLTNKLIFEGLINEAYKNRY